MIVFAPLTVESHVVVAFEYCTYKDMSYFIAELEFVNNLFTRVRRLGMRLRTLFMILQMHKVFSCYTLYS